MTAHGERETERAIDDAEVGQLEDSARTPHAETGPKALIPYSIFKQWERWSIVILVGFAAIFSPLSANVYFPAIPTIASAFHESVENINLTVTVYMVIQGLAPSVWGSIADRKGRRPSFILCLLILMLSCVGLALTPTSAYWLLVVLRCFQAAGSASTVALSAGVIGDIIPPEERGGFTGISILAPSIGPCIGPVLGGVLAAKLGWRSIFWFLTIASGVYMIVLILVLPETLRAQVGNGSTPAPVWNRAVLPIIGRSTLDMQIERPPPRPLPNPFKLFTAPDLMIVLLSTAVLYSAYYAVIATLSTLFAANYSHLTEAELGLCYLSTGGGGAIATVTAGKILDWQFQRVKRNYEQDRNVDSEKNDKVTRDLSQGGYGEFPIEKATMQSQHVWYLLFSVCTVGYGWSLQSKTSIAVPLILQFFLGFSMTAAMTNCQTLIIDLFPTQGSSVSAANNLIRCIMGAVTVSVIGLITDAIEAGWTYTICGILCFLMWPVLLVELKFGPAWRKRREERNRNE